MIRYVQVVATTPAEDRLDVVVSAVVAGQGVAKRMPLVELNGPIPTGIKRKADGQVVEDGQVDDEGDEVLEDEPQKSNV